MNRVFPRAAVAAFALWPALAGALTPLSTCLPRVEGAWVRTPPPGATMLAGYAVLHNACEAPATIVGVDADDFGSAMLHRSVEEGGVARMRAAGEITLAPGERLVLAPGGAHIMLMAPRRALADGADTRIRFKLADGHLLPADFTVRREAPAN
jgi:copper(I)-binding protein